MCIISGLTALGVGGTMLSALGAGAGVTAAAGTAATAGATAGAIGSTLAGTTMGALASGIGTTLSGIGTGLGATAATTATGITAGTLGADIGITAAALGGASTLATGVGQYQQLKQQEKIAEINQEQALNAADREMAQGRYEKTKLALEHRQLVGAGRAALGAGGTALGAGSNLGWEMDMANKYGFDRAQLDYDVRSRTWNYKVAANNYRNQASALSAQRGNLLATMPVDMAGSLLGVAAGGMQGYYAGTEFGKSDFWKSISKASLFGGKK